MVKEKLIQIYTVAITSACFFASVSQIVSMTGDCFKYKYVYENEPVCHGRMDVPDLSICLSLNLNYGVKYTARELFQTSIPYSDTIAIITTIRPSPKKDEDVSIRNDKSFLADTFIYSGYICYVVSWSKHFKAKRALSQSRVDFKQEILFISIKKKLSQKLKISCEQSQYHA